MKKMRLTAAVVAGLALLGAPALATNGMNMEGYGPIAVGMGGASMAYDNGTAAVMNNPATLGAIEDGAWRLDVAFGRLGPTVEANITTPGGVLGADSDGTAYYMPALGLITKRGALTYGFGVFAQGGMGTEFSGTTWLANPGQLEPSPSLMNRSEVTVGRFVVPVTYDVNPKLRLGATADVVWAGLDLKMAMSEGQFLDLATTQQIGTASGSVLQAFGMMYEPFGGTGIQRVHHAYFDFSNDSDITGQAKGAGFGAKIGAVYEVSEQLSLGATYHTKTAISDLETDEATMAMAVSVDPAVLSGQLPSGQYMDIEIPVAGEMTINDFQWPAMLGIGAAYRPMEGLMVAVDVRQVFWSAAMEQFSMTFVADNAPENGGFAGASLDAVLFQQWDDQTVISAGAQYQAMEALMVRAGFNYGANPVPDAYLNALFPAIVESHVTVGAGYAFGESSNFDVSVVKGLTAENTNPGSNVESTHGQLNFQLIYTRNF